MLAVVVLAALVVAAPASATFPGRNGRIVFDVAISFGAPMDEVELAGSDLRAIDPRSGNRVRLARCRRPHPDAPCHDYRPAWSPDGRRLAFERHQYSPEWEPPTPPDRSLLFVGTPDRSHGDPVVDRGHAPVWSPDGRSLAFERPEPPGGPNDLHVRDLQSGTVRRITRGGGNSADWSSRDRIALVAAGRRAGPDIYTIRPDGSGRRRLTRDGRSREPSWSPHATKIAFTRSANRTRDRNDIYLMRAGGGPRRRVVRNGYAPQWSPDGRWIAFARGRDVFRVRPDGTKLRRLYHVPARDSEAQDPIGRIAWRPVPRR